MRAVSMSVAVRQKCGGSGGSDEIRIRTRVEKVSPHRRQPSVLRFRGKKCAMQVSGLALKWRRLAQVISRIRRSTTRLVCFIPLTQFEAM